MSSDIFTGHASVTLFCMVSNGEIAALFRSSSNNLKHFPIYRNLPMIQLDVTNTNINSPYPVSVEQLLKFDIVSCNSWYSLWISHQQTILLLLLSWILLWGLWKLMKHLVSTSYKNRPMRLPTQESCARILKFLRFH